MTDNAQRLAEFMQTVWNDGDVAAVDRFVAEQYVIYSDPGDPWDGQTLTPEAFKQRLISSRAPFPDLSFQITETVAALDRVAITWTMRGTQLASLGGPPASGRAIEVQGMTVYYFRDVRITGHRQVVDRLTVARQLGLTG